MIWIDTLKLKKDLIFKILNTEIKSQFSQSRETNGIF